MEGEQSLQRFSPELTVQDQSFHPAIICLPQIILFHGTGDYSIPSIARLVLVKLLREGINTCQMNKIASIENEFEASDSF